MAPGTPAFMRSRPTAISVRFRREGGVGKNHLSAGPSFFPCGYTPARRHSVAATPSITIRGAIGSSWSSSESADLPRRRLSAARSLIRACRTAVGTGSSWTLRLPPGRISPFAAGARILKPTLRRSRSRPSLNRTGAAMGRNSRIEISRRTRGNCWSRTRAGASSNSSSR